MKKLLIIGYVWPEPDSSAAGKRMMQLIRMFREDGAKVCFASPANPTPYQENLAVHGVDTQEIALNDSSFDAFLLSYNPDLVLFDRYMMEEQFGWRVREKCPEALSVLDTEDLHFLREYRRKNGFEELNVTALNGEVLTKRELASIYRSDLSLIISSAEYQLLTSQLKVPESILLYIPLLEEGNRYSALPEAPGFSQRHGFMFIGNFFHKPNWDAVIKLKELWPVIRKKLPEACIYIYGAYMGEKEEQLHDEGSGFFMKGRVEDAAEAFYQSRVCLAPLRFGAGLKGKLLDAMRFATPSVTTSVGAEGIEENVRWNGVIAKDDTSFIQGAVDLYTNPEAWNRSVANGFAILEEKFNYDVFKKILLDTLETLSLQLEEHRNENIVGAMLRLNNNQAHKYLSKWIEEKNRH